MKRYFLSLISFWQTLACLTFMAGISLPAQAQQIRLQSNGVGIEFNLRGSNGRDGGHQNGNHKFSSQGGNQYGPGQGQCKRAIRDTLTYCRDNTRTWDEEVKCMRSELRLIDLGNSCDNTIQTILRRCDQSTRTWEDEGRCYRNAIDDNEGSASSHRCVGTNMHGSYADGGGCNMHGCWARGGGCDMHGCWTRGGGCNMHGCWAAGGSCSMHGCAQEVESRPFQCANG